MKSACLKIVDDYRIIISQKGLLRGVFERPFDNFETYNGY
jgi:hypothetical protein